jgi:hypothetical protein
MLVIQSNIAFNPLNKTDFNAEPFAAQTGKPSEALWRKYRN